MKRSWSIKKYLLKLELHELLSILMLFVVIGVYFIGLSLNQTIEIFKKVTTGAGIITRTFFTLSLLTFFIHKLFPQGYIGNRSILLSRILVSFLIMLFSFEAITSYIVISKRILFDEQLLAWDQLIFGGKQPSVWMEPIITDFLTNLMSVVYLSWFIFTYGTIFLMVFKGKKEALEYATVVLMTFYIGYILYILVPAYGPLYTYTFSTQVGGLAESMMDPTFYHPKPDVFPSLHTGISAVMLIQIWRSFRIWTWIYAPIMTLIVFSTMYLRFHYGVDVVAGIILALLTSYLCPKLLRLWKKKQDNLERDLTEQRSQNIPPSLSI